MKAFDQRAIEHYKIPSKTLMENAGRSVAEAIVEHTDSIEECLVLVICGKGNNGGDGVCAARHLINMGVEAQVIFVGDPKVASSETREQIKLFNAIGREIDTIQDEGQIDDLVGHLSEVDIVLDALLGIGVEGPTRGLYVPVIEALNESDPIIYALDIPSGVNADSGIVEGEAVRADATFTIEMPKLGLLQHPGAEYAGDILAIPIGYPEALIEEFESKYEWVEDIWLPPRDAHSHKGTFGKVLIVGGSTGLSGAAIMSTEAALRSGAGLVHVAFPSSLQNIVETSTWEALKHPLTEQDGALSEKAVGEVLSIIEKSNIDVVAIGPGLSTTESAQEFVIGLLEQIQIPVVIDADALNALANTERLDLLKSMASHPVLTPHPGEFARLTGLTVEEIENDRIGMATQFAEEQSVTLILKGAPTITALADGSVFINSTGNSGLATGGSGDVLTGLIAGWIAQGLDIPYAAVSGVYLHGLVADYLIDETGERAMLPRNLIAALPEILKEYE